MKTLPINIMILFLIIACQNSGMTAQSEINAGREKKEVNIVGDNQVNAKTVQHSSKNLV